MGGSASRDRDTRRQQANVPVVRQQQQQQQQQPPPMPQHLAQQFPGAYRQAAPARQQQQPQHQPVSTVQEGEKMKLLATIEPSTVKYDPQEKRLTFFLTTTTELCFYEIHSGVRETIKRGEVVYTPNKPKPRPATVTVEGICENREISIVLDISAMEAQELVFSKAFPKQKPCAIVVRYVDDLGEHAEHTSVDLSATQTRRVINQIVATNGSCFLVENLFGADSEVTMGAVMDGSSETGAAGGSSTPKPSPAAADDDDTLCVICITLEKDTAVLPCRHMCLCKGCAQELMRHTPKCPVCRGPISQLLHMAK